MYKTPMQLWVEALRSGKYKQTRGWLRRNNKFCCLGVACELFSDTVEDIRAHSWLDGDYYRDPIHYTNHGGHPPDIVSTWLGLQEHHVTKLIKMNDQQMRSFNTIADFIERELLNAVRA